LNNFTGLLLDLDNEKRPDWEPLAKDITACMTFAANAERPKSIDPRKWYPQYNQKRNDCEGHAAAASSAGAYVVERGEVLLFSPHFAYRTAQEQDGIRGDSGATISGGAKAAMEVGNCPLKACPYPANYSSAITAAMRALAAKYRIKSYGVVKSYDEAFAVILSGLVVNWGLGWDFSGPSSFVLTKFSGRGPGHATALAGYSERVDSKGRNYLWCVNSGWPVPGFYEISPGAVEKALSTSRTVALTHSTMLSPQPAPRVFNPLGV
jgi:hypothetical protein